MSESDPVAKNRTEFQLGSKLLGTSTEALSGHILFAGVVGKNLNTPN